MIRRLLATAIVCGFMLLHNGAYADPASVAQGSDADITDRVSHKLVEADRDVGPRIHVSTVNGVVTLEGTVFSNSQVLRALEQARAVSGVLKVQNHLHVRM